MDRLEHGILRAFGEAVLKDTSSKATWSVFVLAYDLSEEAVLQAMR